MSELNFDWHVIVSNLILMSIAYVLALPIAWNREAEARSAGLRTYPLVALATCAMMLMGIKVLDTGGAESRVMQAIITGMGFIGGGAILKTDNRVTGLATASSLWAVGAMGIAVAWQRYEIALLVSLLTFVTLQLGTPVKKMVNGKSDPD
ncbi:MAG: MgtC/SapB family protein [Xanthomonadales bacterium]|nr:MgtC/SapB family protein [Xanthomonadales bacterium]